MSPAMVTYFDGLLGEFRRGGFPYDLAHHAMHAPGQPGARVRAGTVRARE